MALLSSRKSYDKVAGFLHRYDNMLCFVCFVVGTCWFLLLAYSDLNAYTYFSENALLPGLVESEFYHGHQAAQYYQALKDEVKKRKSSSEELRNRIPMSWMLDKFAEIGLDGYSQNYSFRYPHEAHNEVYHRGSNVYGILRAPRTAGTEAVVLSAPFRSDPFEDNTLAGVALMLSLAKAFRERTYWAKDIIFLLVEDDMIGMQAWLAAYHHIYSEYIVPGELSAKSGSVQAAINLEIGTDKISHVDLSIEGLNGQLPNLDLVNTVARLCRRERVIPTLHKRSDAYAPDSWNGFLHSLKTMLLLMSQLASGSPSGSHSLFHRYSVEAVTLRSFKMKGSKNSVFGFSEMGRVIEGVFRSLNNLLERFHQSFFFYILPSVERYASIGVYMPPFGILTLPVIIKALSLWLSCHVVAHESGSEGTVPSAEEEKATDAAATTFESIQHQNEQNLPTVDDKTDFSSLSQLYQCNRYILVSVFFGVVAFYGGNVFIVSSGQINTSASVGLTVGLIVLHLIILVSPFLPFWKYIMCSQPAVSSKQDRVSDMHVLKSVALLAYGVLLGITAVINISLGFFIAVIYVPLLVCGEPKSYRLLKLVKGLALLLISPACLCCIAVTLHALISQKPSSVPLSVDAVVTAVKDAVMLSFVQLHLLNNWTYCLILLAYFPCWALFWFIMWH